MPREVVRQANIFNMVFKRLQEFPFMRYLLTLFAGWKEIHQSENYIKAKMSSSFGLRSVVRDLYAADEHSD